MKNKKTILITGATGGIGRAFARLLASEGHDLVLVARSTDELHRITGVETAKHQISVTPISLDLTLRGSVSKLAKELSSRKIEPDIIINNAGIGFVGEISKLAVEDQLATIDLNIRALSAVTMRFLPAMIKRNSGGIINVASTAAYMPGPYMAVYYASKAYVQSFTDALANELKGTNIKVMTLSPGPVDTQFANHANQDTKKLLYRLMGPKTADAVAEAGWQGYKAGTRTVIPGIMNLLTAWSAKLLPKSVMMVVVRLFQKPKTG